MGKWVQKAYLESQRPECDGVWMLIFARPDTKWWHEYVAKATEIVFLKGRVKFVHPITGEGDAAPAPSCVVVFRERLVDSASPRLSHWDWRSENG